MHAVMHGWAGKPGMRTCMYRTITNIVLLHKHSARGRETTASTCLNHLLYIELNDDKQSQSNPIYRHPQKLEDCMVAPGALFHGRIKKVFFKEESM